MEFEKLIEKYVESEDNIRLLEKISSIIKNEEEKKKLLDEEVEKYKKKLFCDSAAVKRLDKQEVIKFWKKIDLK